MHQANNNEAVVVLLVEDEMLIRLYATEALQDAGYQVLETRDGVEALAVLELRPEIRAMVTDLVMPNMDGLTLVRVTKERWPAVAVVVVTGAVPEGAKAELPPGVRLVRKPYTAKVLVSAVEDALGLLSPPAVALKSIPTMHAQPLAEPEG